MMSYVLMVILSTSTPVLWSERFPNKESCQVAKVWVLQRMESTATQAVCLEDIAEEPPALENEKPYEMRDSTAPLEGQ
jgi:hypothetical protein